MLTDTQRFTFDVQGYLVLPGVLAADQLARMNSDMASHGIKNPDNDPSKSRFGDFLRWGDDWRSLIDHPAVLPALVELLGPKFRLDHAYGMAMSATGNRGGEGLHHEAGMFHHGCYYVSHGNKVHNGLIVVSWALTDANPGDGGFCCIPGSHKALYPVPRAWFGVNDNPMVKQIAMKAGDVLIFTEALTHGTMAWNNPKQERRSALLKYCPHYMQWAAGPMKSDIPELSERQRLIMQGAYVWERPVVRVEAAATAG